MQLQPVSLDFTRLMGSVCLTAPTELNRYLVGTNLFDPFLKGLSRTASRRILRQLSSMIKESGPLDILRHLQHWFSGRGPHLKTAEFVPETHPIRLWADTFPWDAMVQAVVHSFAQRCPKKRPHGGRPSVSLRVLLAVELLKHELNASDEDSRVLPTSLRESRFTKAYSHPDS